MRTEDGHQRRGLAHHVLTAGIDRLDMIEETARHVGHLDILRERLDGTVGYD